MKIAESTINMSSSREYRERDRERIETRDSWEIILNDRMEAESAPSPRETFRKRLSRMRTEAMISGGSAEAVQGVETLLLEEQQQKMEEFMTRMLDHLFSENAPGRSFGITMVRLEFVQASVPTSLPELNLPELKYTRTQTSVRSHYEKEETGFTADGKVKTADGRKIDFNIGLAMGREFLSEERFTTEESGTVKLIDPLVINFEGNGALLSDAKFSFDLNVDGKEEEISRLLPGSGFLALDLDGDGMIDDGKELFGAITGNGFAELAEYDMDDNNWIDENDPVFGRLSIWRTGDEAEESLESLEEAGIGAIHLESRETLFALTDEDNELHGQIEKTGVFLREEGGAGTVQQVKFAVSAPGLEAGGINSGNSTLNSA